MSGARVAPTAGRRQKAGSCRRGGAGRVGPAGRVAGREERREAGVGVYKRCEEDKRQRHPTTTPPRQALAVTGQRPDTHDSTHTGDMYTVALRGLCAGALTPPGLRAQEARPPGREPRGRTSGQGRHPATRAPAHKPRSATVYMSPVCVLSSVSGRCPVTANAWRGGVELNRHQLFWAGRSRGHLKRGDRKGACGV